MNEEAIKLYELEEIIDKYNLLFEFKNNKEIEEWFNSLNELQKKNFLNIDIDPEKGIKFRSILINKDLLNKEDCIERLRAIESIDNAEGWEHLFDYLVTKDFLDSPKYFQDIEMLKKCDDAKYPLWIIGKKEFIDSPYHDIDFEKLVSIDCNENYRYFAVQENIAIVAGNKDSINSIHHEEDIDTIIRCGFESIQTNHSFPKSIGYLAVNPVSLKDKYHRENMEILANNYDSDICGYLYRIMINEQAINNQNYREVVYDIVNNKDNVKFCYLLCAYLVGFDEADRGTNIYNHTSCLDLRLRYESNQEIFNIIGEKYNVIDVEEAPLKELPEKRNKKERILKPFRIFKK